MANAARRKRLREAGLCSQCTSPPVEGRSRCQKHLDKANELARRRNKERKSYGLCIRCPQKAAEGHVLCDDCMNSLRRRDIDWGDKRDKEKTKQQIRQAAGLCKWCENPNVPGRALCDDHLKVEREKVRAYRAERKAKGLCWRCDNPVRPGGVLCQAHRDEVTARERKKSAKTPLAEKLEDAVEKFVEGVKDAVDELAHLPLVDGASCSVTREVPTEVNPAAVVGEDGAGPREVRRSQPVMTVVEGRDGVDAPAVADVVNLDRVERVAC